MELIAIIVLAALLPVMTIAGFVVGYNVNAPRKLFRMPAKKAKPTENEIMLERIDRATI